MTLTRDVQTIEWVGRAHALDPSGRAGRQLPMRMRAGRPGHAAQNGTTLLAPDQQIAVTCPRNLALFGTETVLCTARSLSHLDGVEPVARGGVNWVYLLTGAADLVCADGLWLSTMVPDMDFLRKSAPHKAREICAALPRLSHAAGLAAYEAPLPELNDDEAALI